MTDGRRTDGKWKIGQCSVGPETTATITWQNTGGYSQMFDNARAMPAMIKICIKAKTAKTPTHRTGR